MNTKSYFGGVSTVVLLALIGYGITIKVFPEKHILDAKEYEQEQVIKNASHLIDTGLCLGLFSTDLEVKEVKMAGVVQSWPLIEIGEQSTLNCHLKIRYIIDKKIKNAIIFSFKNSGFFYRQKVSGDKKIFFSKSSFKHPNELLFEAFQIKDGVPVKIGGYKIPFKEKGHSSYELRIRKRKSGSLSLSYTVPNK